MIPEDMVLASEFCIHHNIELAFIHSLRQHGMIETVVVEEQIFLPVSELPRLEKIVRLYFELDINLEGIETIHHLLQQMKAMQEEIKSTRSRLSLYEKIDG